MIYLRLHQGYTIPGLANKKLSQQRVGPFRVIEAIDKGMQAWRLDLPPMMRIHPIISIAQLEPATPGDDPYDRIVTADPPPVTNAHEDSASPSYEIERLLDKRITRNKPYYLVKWKGYGHQHNVWYSIDNLKGATDLIADYEATAAITPRSTRRRITTADPNPTRQPDIEVRVPRP